MNEIQLWDIDLNLLVVVDVLLEEQSITRAGRRLGRTPSAVSHALRRARDVFGDPLLVQQGRAMVPTPAARALAPRLSKTLAETRRLLGSSERFDPAASRRVFRLSSHDVLASALPDILRAVSCAAPQVSVELVPQPVQPGNRIGEGADLYLGRAHAPPPGFTSVDVAELEWAVAARLRHPLGKRLTRARFVEYPHVVVRTGTARRSSVEQALVDAGLTRRVGLVVSSFLLGAHITSRTDFLFAVPRQLLTPIARKVGLQVLRPPIALPTIRVGMTWGDELAADDGHRWFRELVLARLRQVLSPRSRA